MQRSFHLENGIGRIMVYLTTIFLIACGGGGGSGGGGGTGAAASSAGTPILSALSIASGGGGYSASFTYTDPAGDLDTGGLYANYGGADRRVATFDSSFAGKTSGTASVPIIASFSVGDVVPCWLVDKAGNKSNTVNVTIT